MNEFDFITIAFVLAVIAFAGYHFGVFLFHLIG